MQNNSTKQAHSEEKVDKVSETSEETKIDVDKEEPSKKKEINKKFNESGFWKTWGWRANAFEEKIPDDVGATIVGFDDEIKLIKAFVVQSYKFGMITGPIGAGKTTTLKYVSQILDKDSDLIVNNIYATQNIDKRELMQLISKPVLGFFRRKAHKYETVSTFPSFLNKRLKKKRMILLIDEAQDLSDENFSLLRAIASECSVSIICAGTDKMHRKIPDSLKDRGRDGEGQIKLDVVLRLLDIENTSKLIEKRIQYFDGEDIKPFRIDDIKHIHKKSRGHPRRTIAEANDRLYDLYLKKGEYDFKEKLEVVRRKDVKFSLDVLKNKLWQKDFVVMEAIHEIEEEGIPPVFKNIYERIAAKDPTINKNAARKALVRLQGKDQQFNKANEDFVDFFPLIIGEGKHKHMKYNLEPSFVKAFFARR